ncbi:MAG: exonuclease domain-containing protein [Christensenellales bacterium]
MLIDQLNQLTNHKYDFLRLNQAIVDKGRATVELCFVIPWKIDNSIWNDDAKAEILQACKQLLPSNLEIEVRYVKTAIDADIIKRLVKDYFIKKNKALIGQYDDKEIKVEINDTKVKIIIPAYDYICDYCIKSGVKEALLDYVNSNVNADIRIEFLPIDSANIAKIQVSDEDVFIDRGLVEVTGKKPIMGGGVDLRPKYISRCNTLKAGVCVAGRVSEFSRMISNRGYIFYKFTLNDSTESMKCIAFTRGKKHGALDCVENDNCLVVEGELQEDGYNKGRILRVEKADLCDIDFDAIIENIKASKDSEKKKNKATIKPIDSHASLNLFDMSTPICPLLVNNDVVVFDLETTGTDVRTDRIIEIGAVKIVGGEIVSCYETLVDPKMKIPASASQVNNIYDSDVAGAPYIEDCLGDFMDYCKDCYLVAHNGDGFDFLFVKRECQALGYEFNNKTLDTLTMARKAYPYGSTPKLKNHKLGTLCKFLDIELVDAHRAYNDAEATAKLFIKLANTLNLQ